MTEHQLAIIQLVKGEAETTAQVYPIRSLLVLPLHCTASLLMTARLPLLQPQEP